MILVKAPLRVSFLGGSTDIKDFYSKEEGACLGTTIDKYVYVTLHKRFQNDICVGYTKKEYVKDPKNIKHDLVREALLAMKLNSSLEISTLADIPSYGSGLGSSSSLLVALLKAFSVYKGENINNVELAEIACKIEIDILSRPIGKQDQYWTALGNLNLLVFQKNGTVRCCKIDISEGTLRELDSNLFLFDTGIARNSKDILRTIKNNDETFQLKKQLRDLAYKGKLLLEEGALDFFGELLHKGWLTKRFLSFEISNPEIDQLYELALRLGALGGKVLGAGGGGFFLFYIPLERQKKFREKFPLRELPFHIDRLGVREIFNDE